jgi:hypothetical protein
MKGLHFVLLFTAMTFIAWGAYGPTLRHGTHELDGDALRAFVCVGLAYFLIAVLIPLVILSSNKESGSWTVSGVFFSIVGGTVGALGALGIILALRYQGQPVYVMPLVFGFAPVVNTLVTALIGKTFSQIRPLFLMGIATAALGAVGVLTFHTPAKKAEPTSSPAVNVTPAVFRGQDGEPKPTEQPPTEQPPTEQPPTEQPPTEQPPTEQPPTEQPPTEQPPTEQPPTDTSSAGQDLPKSVPAPKDSTSGNTNVNDTPATKPERNTLGIALSILMAAVCWGSYGPMLHIGQAKMSGSRLRPFMCVGIAYFLVAVIVPLVLIYLRADDTGSWTPTGVTWAFFAGVAGAVGALGVILAFNAGGKPIYVMPLIFGFAPVINTFITLSENGTWNQVQPLFWVSLGVVIAGAVTVLVTAPKPKPKPGH